MPTLLLAWESLAAALLAATGCIVMVVSMVIVSEDWRFVGEAAEARIYVEVEIALDVSTRRPLELTDAEPRIMVPAPMTGLLLGAAVLGVLAGVTLAAVSLVSAL